MSRLGILAPILLLAPFPAGANTVDCGGNSYSHAEVVEGRRPHRRAAPLEVMPDSLCADLIEVRRSGIDSIEVMIDPSASREAEAGATDGTPPGRTTPRR